VRREENGESFMAELYLSDKPTGMRELDVHDAIIEGVKRDAKFLALVNGSTSLKELVGSWAVQKGPSYKNPAAKARPDNNDRAKPAVPHQLDGVMEIFESQGWSVNWVADRLKAIYESKGQTVSAAKADDSSNLALSIERVLLSAQECRKEGANAALTRGIASWLATAAHAVDGVSEVPAELRPAANQWYTGTLAAFNEAALKSLCLAAYKRRRGAVNLTGFVGIDLKQAMSAFTEKVDVTATMENVRQLASQKQRELETICDVFRYDGAEIMAMTQSNLFADATNETLADTVATDKGGLFLDMSMIQMRWLDKIVALDDTPDNHGKSGFFRAAGRLEVLNPSWMFAVKPSA